MTRFTDLAFGHLAFLAIVCAVTVIGHILQVAA
jgi:hypothetical protein